MSSGVSFDGRFRGRADAFPVFWRLGGNTGEAAACFRLTGAELAVDLARVTVGGFEAFRGAALGDGSDRGAVERFFAIYYLIGAPLRTPARSLAGTPSPPLRSLAGRAVRGAYAVRGDE